MTKKWVVAAGCILLMLSGYAQNIAINADGTLPDKHAILDVKSANKGILIPRMSSAARDRIPNTRGLLVYDTTTDKFWYNTGKAWQPVSASLAAAGDAWLLFGNNNTTDSVNFLGTTNDVPLNIRVNNQASGRIDSAHEVTFWGYKAGFSDNHKDTTTRNTGIGAYALQANTYGAWNSAFGNHALYNNIQGISNVAVAYESMYHNAAGNYNTAIGNQALYANILGHGLVATGYQSLYHNTNGVHNTGDGYVTLHSNTTGGDNTAVGYYSLFTNTTGEMNTALGASSLRNNIYGSYNTALGNGTLYTNTVGTFNTAVGFNALNLNVEGAANTAVGAGSLGANTTGLENTAIGSSALGLNQTGGANTAIGSEAMLGNMDGYSNTVIGMSAMRNGFHGYGNTAIGVSAMLQNTGSGNTAAGQIALYSNTTGCCNAAFGDSSLRVNETGSFNTAVGYGADLTLSNLSNATALGSGAIVDASNKVRIGNGAVTVIEGQVPFTTPSDGRFKYNVQEDVKGLDFILQLRPVTYQFDVKRLDEEMGHKVVQQAAYAYDEASRIRRSGFIAQDVEKAALATGYNFSGLIRPKAERDHYSLSYDAFVVPLVKAVQEQQQTIEAQNKKIAQLEQAIEELKKAFQNNQPKH